MLIFVLSSCKNDVSVIGDSNETEESMALRIVLNNLKEHSNHGKVKDNLCFDFVYPIQLKYNNGSFAKVDSYNGLLDVIYAETKDLFITSIEMPFEVIILESLSQVIHSEEDFFDLIADCEIDMPGQNDFFDGCFSFQYPIGVITIDGTTHSISSNESFVLFLQENSDNWWFEFVFPLTVVLEDSSVVVLENDYDLFNVLDSCFGCGCEQIYEPICVEFEEMVYQFSNECEALCAGFTPNDFVSCDDVDDCFISNFVATPGLCNTNNTRTYSLTIDFEYKNPTDETFLVGTTDGIIFSYALADLPITIPNYSGAGEVNIIILNSTNCTGVAYFDTPDCAK